MLVLTRDSQRARNGDLQEIGERVGLVGGDGEVQGVLVPRTPRLTRETPHHHQKRKTVRGGLSEVKGFQGER